MEEKTPYNTILFDNIMNQMNPTRWYKVLNELDQPIDGSIEQWSLPESQSKGEWMFLNIPIGTWLVQNPKTFYKPGYKVYAAEYRPPSETQLPGIIWVKKVRLIREATQKELQQFGIYKTFMQII